METSKLSDCEKDCMKFINSNNSEDKIAIQVSDIISALSNKYSQNEIYLALNNLRIQKFIDGGVKINKDEMGNDVTDISPILIIE